MEWEQVRVTHARYGEGSVLSCENGFVKVRFDDATEKSFLYPDAFVKFLRTSNQEAAAKATSDIILKKAEEDAIRREQEELQNAIAAAAAASAVKKPAARKRTAKK